MATRCCRQSVLPQPAAGQSRWPEALPRRLVPDWRIASVRKCSQGCSDYFCCSWRVGWRGNKRAGMARPEPHSAWQRCRSESTGYRFRQPDTDRQWEMIRKSGFQRLVFQYFQGRRDQDMVDGALWLPAGEGLWSSIGKLKPGAGAELFEFMTLRAGIEVAHDDHIRVCRDQVGHVAKLLKSCAPAQSEVKNDHHHGWPMLPDLATSAPRPGIAPGSRCSSTPTGSCRQRSPLPACAMTPTLRLGWCVHHGKPACVARYLAWLTKPDRRLPQSTS